MSFHSYVVEVLKAVAIYTGACILFEGLFAVFISAFSLSDLVVGCVNWGVSALFAFLVAAFFVKEGRALFKGGVVGLLGCVFTMLVFGFIGGFRLTALFLLKLLVCTLVGAGGAIVGVNLKKR